MNFTFVALKESKKNVKTCRSFKAELPSPKEAFPRETVKPEDYPGQCFFKPPHGGYVIGSVGLFVRRINRNVLDEFQIFFFLTIARKLDA